VSLSTVFACHSSTLARVVRGDFVYTNGIKDANAFEDVLKFRPVLVPHDGRRDWVLGAFRDAVALVTSAATPPPGERCGYYRFAGRWTTLPDSVELV
jgi:hypothetical protein